MLELEAGIGCGELPVCFGASAVAVVLPCVDFIDESSLIRDTPAEALGGERCEFGLGQIEP